MSRVEEVELTNMCMICDGKGNVLVQTWSDLSPVSQILLRIFRVKFFSEPLFSLSAYILYSFPAGCTRCILQQLRNIVPNSFKNIN